MEVEKKHTFTGTYIDLFSGCGGLSLGLGKAGWQGVFSVEKDSMAFDTFKHNMLGVGRYEHFDWPSWLPQAPTTIQDLIKEHLDNLKELRGKVDLIAGGPPCQGFSLAGMRNPDDPRNQLSKQYIEMVELIQPKFLLLENVRGFNSIFKNGQGEAAKKPYSQIVKESLENLGYTIFSSNLNTQNFGVPQSRTRFIMIGVRSELIKNEISPFEILEKIRPDFLKSKGLPNRPITVKEAIGDLEISRPRRKLVHHSGSEKNGFLKIHYTPPKKLNAYQAMIRDGLKGYQPNGLRLAKHAVATVEKFQLIQRICRPGVALDKFEKAIVGTKKQATSVLDPAKPSKTITTLPDDLLHYKEPRILTVRENARIQSFPDNFEFKGKYTTGGKRRTKECPKYTQVANAVPPLLGEALGLLVKTLQEGVVDV